MLPVNGRTIVRFHAFPLLDRLSDGYCQVNQFEDLPSPWTLPKFWKSCLFFRLRTGRNEDLTPGTTGAAQLSVNRHQRAIEHLGQRHVPSVVTGQVVSPMPIRGRQTARRGNNSRSSRSRSSCALFALSREILPTCSNPAQDVARFGQYQFPDWPKSPQRQRTLPISLPAPSRPGLRQARTRRRLPSRPVRITGHLKYWKVEPECLPLPCARELLAARCPGRAGIRSVPTHSGGIPAWIGVATPHAPQARRALPGERL